MSQYKVRALGKDGIWHYGVYPYEPSKVKDGTMPMFTFWKRFRSEYYKKTFSLSTGLSDKQGKEIYGGDIVKYDTENGIVTALVEWEKSEEENQHISGFVFKPIKNDDIPDDCDDGVFEIIGNIYENKD